MPRSSAESPPGAEAGETAETLGLTAQGFSFKAVATDEGLQLRSPSHPGLGGFTIDWLSADHRRRIAGGRRQLLPKAVGLAKNPALCVIDATGGLGRDAFTLAALGASVTLIERNPAMALLLRDARARALASDDAMARDAAGRIVLVEADACDWIATTSPRADAIHLDPMYPDDGKTALPQKAMQWLRALTGGDADADALLRVALAAPVRRVAVKRALKAPWLAGLKPGLEFSGTQARYDVYLNTSAPKL